MSERMRGGRWSSVGHSALTHLICKGTNKRKSPFSWSLYSSVCGEMKQQALTKMFLPLYVISINQSILAFKTWEAGNGGRMISSESDVLMYEFPIPMSLSLSLHHFISSLSLSLCLGRAAQSPTVLPWRCWLENVPVRWSRWQWNRLKPIQDWLGWWVTPANMNVQFRRSY